MSDERTERESGAADRLIVFSDAVVAIAMTLLAMVHHMISAHLQAPDTPPRIAADTNLSCIGVILGFGISIPLFFVFRYAWVLWIIGPVLAGQIGRRRDHRATRQG